MTPTSEGGICAESDHAPEHDQIAGLHSEPLANSRPATHISQLPNEILAEVFRTLKAETRFFDDHRVWYEVNLVCRHWRDVAIAASFLWASILPNSHDHTLLMLERSRMANLSISVDSRTSGETAIAILRHSDRIRSLEMDHYDDNTMEATINRFLGLGQPYSRLDSLSITLRFFDWKPRSRLQCHPMLRQLQILCLKNIAYDWGIFPLPNLAHLCLSGHENFAAPIQAQQFLEALSQMPKLETLAVHLTSSFCLSPTDDTGEDGGGKEAFMPHLSNMSIAYSDPCVVNYVLSRLRIPRLSTLHVKSNADDDYEYLDIDSHEETIGLVASLVDNGDFSTGFKYLTMDEEDVCMFDDSERHKPGLPNVRLEHPSFGWREFSPGLRHRIVKLAGSRLSSVSDARVGWSLVAEACFEFLATLPGLKRIVITDSALLAPLTSALTIPQDLPAVLADIPFPQLDSITCYNPKYPADAVLNFYKCLSERRDRDAPVKEVGLFQCYYPGDQVLLLEDVIRNEIWKAYM